jgi:DDE superfamily endonuclease
MTVFPRTGFRPASAAAQVEDTSCPVVNRQWSFGWNPLRTRHWNPWCARRRPPMAWPSGPASSDLWRPLCRSRTRPAWWASHGASYGLGASAFAHTVCQGWQIAREPVAPRSCPPAVAGPLGTLAGERPDQLGRSLSPWDCRELARQLAGDGMVEHLSPEPVRRLLVPHPLQPWRHHRWLSPNTPRDAEFSARVSDVVSRSTRRLRQPDLVLGVDETTSVPPRPRVHATRPAMPGRPHQVEHDDRRDGALNLLAGFDTRTGRVYGPCDARQRQREVIAFWEDLDAEIPGKITSSHLLCDHARPHHGKPVHEWLQSHPRFVLHFTPVHCSWLNQVEQWFSILQRKRRRIVDCASMADLQTKLMPCIAEWNEVAHPFNWTTTSVAKVMADAVSAAA